MRFPMLLLALASCLLLSGCASLLERSYSVVEPYADRYWDSAAEDTLKAENYQDLVNSLLMQVEQRAETCVIRGYGQAAGYGQARAASREIRTETIPGAYLLEGMTFTFENGENYCTFTFQMRYREDAEDIDSLMSLSDCQSLVDLLRLSVREEHDRLTARFVRDMRREEVRAAVESLWQELCRGGAEDPSPVPPEPDGEADGEAAGPPSVSETPEEPEKPEEPPAAGSPEPEAPSPGDAPPSSPPPPGSGGDGAADGESGEPDAPQPPDAPPDGEPLEAMAEEPIAYPPCPWQVSFYPNADGVGIVEVLLLDGLEEPPQTAAPFS